MMATAVAAATAVPAQAGGKPFQAPEIIVVNRLTAPSSVEFTYRCRSDLRRTLVVELTAPGTDFYMKSKGRLLNCNSKPQRYKEVLTEPVDGRDRPLKPGETGRVFVGLYDGPRGELVQTRLMTAH
ncbi:hypothetical protein GCM10010278_77700 [Streptomyces melanogenes]|nr:hypothetical protein GCM10010278_77700 [Streptomyces melanogenes]